jgi:osmotically-inducible protein OsmY
MTDEELRRNVTDELVWDPKVDSDAIAVSARNGIVTLRGTVGSRREKPGARKAAERVFGVEWVVDQLDVRPLNDDRRDDADIRGDVLRTLMLNRVVPDTVAAKVKDGFDTLTGRASWQYQREEAEYVAGNVRGVTGVQDDIQLTGPRPEPGDITQAIQKAFRRNADGIEVVAADGTVSLTGTVRSWSKHDAALAEAWAGRGVMTFVTTSTLPTRSIEEE